MLHRLALCLLLMYAAQIDGFLKVPTSNGVRHVSTPAIALRLKTGDKNKVSRMPKSVHRATGGVGIREENAVKPAPDCGRNKAAGTETRTRTIVRTLGYRFLSTLITAVCTGMGKAVLIHVVLAILHYFYERIWWATTLRV